MSNPRSSCSNISHIQLHLLISVDCARRGPQISQDTGVDEAPGDVLDDAMLEHQPNVQVPMLTQKPHSVADPHTC